MTLIQKTISLIRSKSKMHQSNNRSLLMKNTLKNSKVEFDSFK